MQTLILNASPRDKGNSAQLSAFVQTFIPSRVLRVCDYKIKACNGCDACKKSGSCVLRNDDMNFFYTEIKNAQRIVIISPIYFFGVPSHFKALIDRTQIFWHHPLTPEKEGIVLLHGEQPNASFVDCYRRSFHYIFRNWGVLAPQFLFFGQVKTFEDVDLSLVKKFLLPTQGDGS